MNYQDIIAQALRAGFQPYGGNSGQMQTMVNGLEVSPYLETMGQSEQDMGTARQMGYTVSTPLGGTNYRSDVVDMSGNLLRSNVHDAGADKYGLRDMAKMAAFALGANALGSALGQPSMFSSGGLLGGGATAGAEAGSLTAGVTPASVAAFEAGLPAAGAGTLATAATTAAGAGAAGSLLKYALPLAGAVLGGTSGGQDTTATTTKSMDPRLANYVYGADGTGGLLGSATKLFNDQMATGGLNELQRQGIDMQKNHLMNPAYAQGYTNMMNVGQGLLGGGVAGNPFRR